MGPPVNKPRPRPLSFPPSRPRYDPRVSDTWPPPGTQKPEPLLEHIRDVWTRRYVETNCTAAIWRNDFACGLRVEHGGELIESRLSRYGEAPLRLIAEQAKQNLLKDGWTELPLNATPSSHDTH